MPQKVDTLSERNVTGYMDFTTKNRWTKKNIRQLKFKYNNRPCTTIGPTLTQPSHRSDTFSKSPAKSVFKLQHSQYYRPNRSIQDKLHQQRNCRSKIYKHQTNEPCVECGHAISVMSPGLFIHYITVLPVQYYTRAYNL